LNAGFLTETPDVLVIQIEISATTVTWVLRCKNAGGTVRERDLEQLTDFEVVDLELRPPSDLHHTVGALPMTFPSFCVPPHIKAECRRRS
jgi:hypothetical protein